MCSHTHLTNLIAVPTGYTKMQCKDLTNLIAVPAGTYTTAQIMEAEANNAKILAGYDS